MQIGALNLLQKIISAAVAKHPLEYPKLNLKDKAMLVL